MFKIRSINFNTVRNQPINPIQSITCNKSDYQLQCTFNTHPLMQNSNTKYSLSKTIQTKINYQIKRNHQFSIKFTNKQNIIKPTIYINNVQEKQQKKIKCLQFLTKNIKCSNVLFRPIKHEIISFHYQNNSQKKRIQVSMEDMFRYYIQYYWDKLRKSLLNGSVRGKIIVPFLVMWQKIKKDQQDIQLVWEVNEKNDRKCINKVQIFKVFDRYEPKLSLMKQIQEKQQKNNNIYEKLYKKYEDTPFDGKLPVIGATDQSSLEQNHCNKKDTICMMEEELQKKIQSLTDNQSSITTKNQIQGVKVQENRQSFQKEIEGQKIKSCLKKQSKIKERFQDRFKRQLKQLSDDTSVMIKSKALQ